LSGFCQDLNLEFLQAERNSSVTKISTPYAMSRRAVVLEGMACATGVAAVFAVATEVSAAKLPQKSVAYRPTPNGDKKCGNCSLFEPPDACKSVDGIVSAEGFCILWKTK
jgi:hypothetical protein